MSTTLVLYTTAGCHLCEQATALLREQGMTYSAVDIAEDPRLLEEYGIRIPVVRTEQGAELGWPFDAGTLQNFCSTE